MPTTFDVIIIGGGPAGYVAAIRSAQLGLATAVVEKDRLGGVCVNIGCIPTKALLHSANLIRQVRDSAEFGIEVGAVKTDYGKAMQRSRRVAEQNSKGVDFLMKKHKITVVRGTGVLQPGRKVKVGNETHEAKKAVIVATGSRVKGIPAIGLEINKTTVISSDEALFLQQAPASLAVIGAGAVGMEFADVYASFGSKVTVIEALDRVLPLEDRDASDAVAKSFKKRGIDVLAGARLEKSEAGKDGVKLLIKDAKGEARTIEVERVLVAVGRAPIVDDIGLDAAGVKVENGFIAVDERLRTSADGVYAIGDVARPPLLAHKGSHEGIACIEAIHGDPHAGIDYQNIPNCTYCHPEVASVGLTEEAARAQRLDIQVGVFPWNVNGRALTAGATEGFVKVVADARYDDYGDFGPHHLVVKRSTDGGVTWRNSLVDNTTSHGELFDPVKVGEDGTVYVAWSDGHDIYMAYSTDAGNSFSDKVRVNDRALYKTNLMPWLEAGSAGLSFGGARKAFARKPVNVPNRPACRT